mgnify:CR=1 FL=1
MTADAVAFPALLVLGACLAWAIDNNLTRKVSLADASWIAMVKGLAAGSTNLVLALLLGAAWPEFTVVMAAAACSRLDSAGSRESMLPDGATASSSLLGSVGSTVVGSSLAAAGGETPAPPRQARQVARLRIAEGVELEDGGLANAQLLEQLVGEGQQLDIGGGRRCVWDRDIVALRVVAAGERFRGLLGLGGGYGIRWRRPMVILDNP